MFQINLDSAEPQWFPWPEGEKAENQAQLLIRPYPTSKSETIMRPMEGDSKKIEIILRGEERREAFLYCLMDAKDLSDQNGKAIKLNQKILVQEGEFKTKISMKEFIYEYQFKSGLPLFVLKKGKALEQAVEDEEKN